ncbi:HSP20-like chaperone [Syncephalis plumigaleata]|nr:HSP20-like chaperone [Syncephalis plumigaleata]
MALWARGMGGGSSMDPMESAMNRMMHDFWGSPRMMMRRGGDEMMGRGGGGGDSDMMMRSTWCPAVDVCDENDRMIVHADLPGVKKNDIKIEMKDECIQISGETKHQAQYNRENIQHSERRYGKFVRSIPLPNSVDASQAKAKFEDGVLCVEMPKKTDTKPKQINIS